MCSRMLAFALHHGWLYHRLYFSRSKIDALSSFVFPHGNTFKGSIKLAGVQCLIVYQRVIATIAFGQQALRCRIATQPCHCRPGVVQHWMLESCATLHHLGYITAFDFFLLEHDQIILYNTYMTNHCYTWDSPYISNIHLTFFSFPMVPYGSLWFPYISTSAIFGPAWHPQCLLPTQPGCNKRPVPTVFSGDLRTMQVTQ